jgi:hypothetical protein
VAWRWKSKASAAHVRDIAAASTEQASVKALIGSKLATKADWVQIGSKADFVVEMFSR